MKKVGIKIVLFLAILSCISFLPTTVFKADSGWDSSYESDHDSDSSWGSSWDDDFDSDSHSSSDYEKTDFHLPPVGIMIMGILALACAIIAISVLFKNDNKK